jgi:hypothetical protein
MLSMASIQKQMDELEDRLQAQQVTADLSQFRNDPMGYAKWMGVTLQPLQEKALNLLMQPPYKVMLCSGHNVGKTWFMAFLTNWWYDTRDPGLVITTAPTKQDVVDLLWSEVRLQRMVKGLGGFIGPRATEMYTSPEHWAKGFTASRGESLDGNTVIDTPDGKKRFGDLRIGDRVFGVSGLPVLVTGVFHNGERPAYRVTTETGISVVADANHLWTVINPNGGWRGWVAKKYGRKEATYETITTSEIIARGVTYKHNGKDRNKFFLPPYGSVQYPIRRIPIPAYTMGVWLGDGTCHNGTITSADQEVFDELCKDNPFLLVTARPIRESKAKVICVRRLRKMLREIGLLGGKTEEKRVPQEYMENSEEIRLAVLQGLMDTDGYVTETGTCTFGCTSKGLVEDVVWLARSLGGKASMREKPKMKKRPEGGFFLPMYHANIRIGNRKLFRLERKQARIKADFKPRKTGIKSIEPCGQADMVCITVDAHDGLFLANDFAVTHNSFSGRHRPNMLFLMDEATAIDEVYFSTTRTQFQPTGEHGWVACCNPVAVESPLYQEYMRASNGFPKVGWHVIHMDSREHPNIALDLAGREEGLVPGAVRVAQLEEWIQNWCDPLPKGEDIQEGFDFQWPADSGHWWHPGPQFEARVMGQWPSQGTYNVWPTWLWNRIDKSCGYGPNADELKPFTIPEIGCDVARFGDDNTAIHCQDGGVSIHHEEHNGWSLDRTAGRLKQLAHEMYEHVIRKQPAWRNSAAFDAKMIRIKIDVDGMGPGVVDYADGYGFIGISASTLMDGDYRNLRSQLWFDTKKMALAGMVHLGRLDAKTRATLRQQAMSPIYKVNRAGQNELEEKADTKKRLKRSPDSMDCLNLAMFNAPELMPADTLIKDREPDRASRNRDRRAKLFR